MRSSSLRGGTCLLGMVERSTGLEDPCSPAGPAHRFRHALHALLSLRCLGSLTLQEHGKAARQRAKIKTLTTMRR